MSDPTKDDILIIDDVGSSRELLGSLLKQVCYLPVRMARNGQEAIECFQDHRPRLIFLDIDLPDQSGLDLLRRFHEQDESIFIVMVSGIGTPHNVKDSREHGASAFVLKPFKPQKIIEALILFERKSGHKIIRQAER
ncbi:MAG: response regulator [Burkholderiales bacterium]|nr:response regulator [Burkholderiales bacterium]